MNSRLTVGLSEFSKGHWADEPAEPPPHPAELNLVAKARSWLSKPAPLMRARSWLGELSALTKVWWSLTEIAPLTFVRYLIAFFIGVVATVAWQSYSSGTKEETVVATPAALDSVRQSVDRLAAEITRMKSMEQNILERISAPPPQPVGAPARSPAQRPSSVR